MFGKVMETYFEKDCNTSWVIDALEQKNDDKYCYDTLKLYRMFYLGLTDQLDSSSKCYTISLYIKRDEECEGPYYDTKLTLSKIKNIYSGKSFVQAELENDVLISPIIEQLDSFDFEKEKQDIFLKTPLVFKAKAAVAWSDTQKTKTYRIVGLSLERGYFSVYR